MLVLTVDSYGAEQLVIFNSESVSGSSMTVIDSRTVRVHLVIGEDFLIKVPVPEVIKLSGFATVKYISFRSSGASLSAQFMLDLELVEEVSFRATCICQFTNVLRILFCLY